MKKLFALFAIAGMLFMGVNANAMVQEEGSAEAQTEEQAAGDTTNAEAAQDTTQAQETAPAQPTESTDAGADSAEEAAVEEGDPNFHQIVKERFIQGDWKFMGIVLVCLVLGLAIAIERIITLNFATTNTKKLLSRVETALESGGVEEAKNVTKSTRGPVASIFTQGLMRVSEGVEMAEKSIVSYGSVEMGRLERGLVWISLFIALAPMLGFMGTVIGMIDAFDSIETAGDLSPSIVARGIKVALLTTVAGLIVAVILQLFYNYCVSKIDSLVNQMEDASISMVDLLVKHNENGKQLN